MLMMLCLWFRRVDVKKAWAVHLAEQQQKEQEGSDAEEEEAELDAEAVDPAEVRRLVADLCLNL